jgi:Flp pilus assembly protein TadG
MMRAAFARIRSDQRGASIVELALVAPFMAALVIGMSDLARGYSMKLIVEQAAQRAIELTQQQKSVAASYTSGVAADAQSAMTAAGYSTGNTITADEWLECSSNGTTWTRQSSFTGFCPNSTDITARYVSVQVRRDFTPMFTSRAWPGANADGTITVSGFAEVRVQ